MPAADDPIEQLLAGRYPDPDTGELIASESRSVVIADSLEGREADVVDALDLGRHVAVISDVHTHAGLGRRVERALGGRFQVQSIVLPASPHADADTIATLVAAIEPGVDAIITVGSGTLNDVSKMVAIERARPQLVFATAPSMNGYTSLSASITIGGVKKSVRARTPRGVFMDLGVLAAAPPRLIRAGIGDSACRPTAQADWLLSHLLLDRPYRSAPFAMLAADEAALFAQADAVVAGALTAMRHLARVLVLSGFGMTISNGSHPASQGEHLISHYLESHWPPGVPHAFHGEQVGVCTVAMARLQGKLLASETPPVLRPSTIDRDVLVRRYGEDVGEVHWSEYAPKRIDAAMADALNARLAATWDAMRARLDAVRMDADEIARMLAAAGAASEPAGIGCPEPLFVEAMRHARELRNRYTFLDLAADSHHA